MGDDMGCTQFAYLGCRLDFLNIPHLSTIGGRLFSQAELIYYPGDKIGVKNNVRGSLGFGLTWPLN